jgi:Helicase conserved C-terminal domain
MAGNRDKQADGHTRRVARNGDEVRLASHLITTARDRLTGRDEAGQELVGVRPRECVVLGVLLPQPRALIAPPTSASPLLYEPGVPVDHLPASEMGLTALIKANAGTITLNVRSSFALYLQHAPTHEQQSRQSGLTDLTEDDLPVDERPSDGGPETGPEGADDPPPAEGTDIPQEPTADELGALPPDVAAAVRAAVRGVRPDADDGEASGRRASTSADASGGPKRPSDFFRPVYRRYDIEVEHDVEIPIPVDARPHTVGEQPAYDRAISAAVADATARATGVHAGSLLAPMVGPSAMRVPRSVVVAGPDAYEAYLREHARPDWDTPVPSMSFQATVQRTPEGPLRLSVTLVNETPQPKSDRGFLPEVAAYDAGFGVTVTGAQFVPSEYRVVERDYRTEPLVYAHGRFCCLDEDIFAATGELRTTSLPVHRQMVYESRPELQPSFADLAADPVPVLERVERHMDEYASAWDSYLATAQLPVSARIACETDRAAFGDEIRRFRRGLQLIRDDLAKNTSGLAAAFIRANEAIAWMNTRDGLDDPGPATATTWRLFQIVYVVANLAALAAREAPAAERLAWAQHRIEATSSAHDLEELNIADVLWFPTGGGKSAALYGIIAVALFFDRLRGKSAGVTAVLRFPLRMLSVQQLELALRLVAACELVRVAHNDPGAPFRLGYWVGRNNTPNRITDADDERWHDISWMDRQSAKWKRDNAVLPSCPYCGQSRVALDPDPEALRLAHTCGDCQKKLPVDVTDDEVYRYLPAVLVGTVDKIASLAFNAHASHLTHGPAFQCPDHGYVTHAQGRDRRCLARHTCTRTPDQWNPVSIKDPAPALVIQDELHLLSEELGTFAAHYETLWQHLCTVGSGLPSKVLAATATISDYQNQVTQLYALKPRRFPTDGWADGESFYAKRHDDLVRRVFVGALPTQMDIVQFAIAAGDVVRTEVTRLANVPADVAVKTLGLTATPPDSVAELLFKYELECFYCNRKTHADRIHTWAERAVQDGRPSFQSVRLNGQTPLAEISDVIRRVQRESLTTVPEDRLGSISGTSLISHGIDLERLNVLFVLGMPSTIAYYVQATSRAGRTGVGIVFTGLARHFVRDRSVFHFFDVQHRYVNVLVEPVALNRFSTHGPRKTAGGLLAAILTQQWARDAALLATIPGITAPANLSRADLTRILLARLRAKATVGNGPDPVNALQDAVRAAYGLHAAVLDPHIAQLFTATVDGQVASLLASVEAAHESLLTRSMRPQPPRSLREVDASADFGTASYPATQVFKFLGAACYDNDEADYSIADEED